MKKKKQSISPQTKEVIIVSEKSEPELEKKEEVGLKMSSIPSERSLEDHPNIPYKFNQKKVNHAHAYKKMR